MPEDAVKGSLFFPLKVVGSRNVLWTPFSKRRVIVSSILMVMELMVMVMGSSDGTQRPSIYKLGQLRKLLLRTLVADSGKKPIAEAELNAHLNLSHFPESPGLIKPNKP